MASGQVVGSFAYPVDPEKFDFRSRRAHQIHQQTKFLPCQTHHFRNDLPHVLYKSFRFGYLA